MTKPVNEQVRNQVWDREGKKVRRGQVHEQVWWRVRVQVRREVWWRVLL